RRSRLGLLVRRQRLGRLTRLMQLSSNLHFERAVWRWYRLLALKSRVCFSFQEPLSLSFTAASIAARKATGFSEAGGTDRLLMKIVGVFLTPSSSPRFRSDSTLAFTCSPPASFLKRSRFSPIIPA